MSVFELVDSVLDDMFDVTAVPVSYSRDGVTLYTNIPAKLGSMLFRTDDAARGITIRTEQRDFIIRAADVSGLDEPKKGDEIIWDGKAYMVAAPNGEPCWKWHTRHSHTQIRIHAKYIGDIETEGDEQ